MITPFRFSKKYKLFEGVEFERYAFISRDLFLRDCLVTTLDIEFHVRKYFKVTYFW